MDERGLGSEVRALKGKTVVNPSARWWEMMMMIRNLGSVRGNDRQWVVELVRERREELHYQKARTHLIINVLRLAIEKTVWREACPVSASVFVSAQHDILVGRKG